MGKKYDQLSLEERCKVAGLHAQGRSIRQIAADLDRSPSTIARELKRNGGRAVGYKPSHAQERTRARRWKGSRLERNPELRKVVLDCLRKGWSPEQTCGRLEREHGRRIISPESIYRFIAAQIARHKDYSWRHFLPRGKAKRGRRGRRGGSSALHIKKRVSIDQRPQAAADRSNPGHWEADLMSFAKYGQTILTLHERSSRLLIAVRSPDKTAARVARTITDILGALPLALRQTITFDNGTEFAHHYELHHIHLQTFFCDPYAPWQKGGVENAIGRMRRSIPRKTDLAFLSDKSIADFVRDYNNTPRKCLDWHSPAELFLSQVLHFKRESTSPPSRG
jgi:transposase, IS30 family